MTNEPYYLAYEQRYKKVFEAGGGRWGHDPDSPLLIETLTEWVKTNGLEGKKIIEFACGEGASGVVLSKLGCIYHGVDIAPSAVEKAKETLAEFPDATVSRLDMVLESPGDIYDAALDSSGFHMLITESDRSGYLKNALSCLKSGAPMLFFQEVYRRDSDDTDYATFEDFKKASPSDYTTPQERYAAGKDGGEVKVFVPLVPARGKTESGYREELTRAGFAVERFVEMEPDDFTPNAATIYVRKPF